jgi:hypothetical protein
MGNLLSTNQTTTNQQQKTQALNTASVKITLPQTIQVAPVQTTEIQNTPIITTMIYEEYLKLVNAQKQAEDNLNNLSNVATNITITQTMLSTTSNVSPKIEGFAVQPQTQDLYQTPLYIPSNGSPELDDYISTYNRSVALLDDPNRMSQANFDAYVHMQDNKLAQLQASISSFPAGIRNQNNPIKSIKNLKTSVGLNVEPYPDPATQTSLPTYYKGNGATTYPNYLIYANNGCLQYTPGNPSTKTAATWDVRACNSNLPSQRFNMQQVNNISQYNGLITDPNNASYKITDPNSTIFGFYVVSPEGNSEQCLQLNRDGLSVMPCNMDSSQRFKPYYHSITP